MTNIYFVRHAQPNYNNHDDKMLDLPKSGEGTFTLAYNSLCDILKEII